jgi:ABC-type amino acid transport system permease subunit
MNHWQSVLGVIAGLITIFCFTPYITTIFQGKTRPNRATWWIWATNGAILCSSSYASGASNTLWILICSVIGQFVVALIALKYGEGGWTRFDRRCLLGAITSLMLWRLFSSPILAILCTIVIDFFGALPTVRKSYLEPEKEDLLTWSLYTLASVLNLFAIETFSFAIFFPAIYVFVINSVILLLVLRPKFGIRNLPRGQGAKFRKSRA